jgi:hypothetical protein
MSPLRSRSEPEDTNCDILSRCCLSRSLTSPAVTPPAQAPAPAPPSRHAPPLLLIAAASSLILPLLPHLEFNESSHTSCSDPSLLVHSKRVTGLLTLCTLGVSGTNLGVPAPDPPRLRPLNDAPGDDPVPLPPFESQIPILCCLLASCASSSLSEVEDAAEGGGIDLIISKSSFSIRRWAKDLAPCSSPRTAWKCAWHCQDFVAYGFGGVLYTVRAHSRP